jgi:hypothetical protein
VKYVFANTTAKGKKVKSFTSEHFRVSNFLNHVTLRIKVKKKNSNEFDGLMHARVKKLNPHAYTPAAVKKNEINPKYENTRTIHRLLIIQNPGFLYKV